MVEPQESHIVEGPIKEGKRTFYMCKCPFCGELRKVRSESIHKIKSCLPCHHRTNRPLKPIGEFEWCNKCKKWKQFSDFNFRTGGKVRSCKECENNYRLQNLQKINEYSKKYRKNNIQNSLFYSAKSRAKKNGLEFNIELSDIIVPTECPVLGIEISTSKEKNNSPSLDKIIPSLGYTKGNVRVISWRANWIKNNMTPEEAEKLYNDSRKWKCIGSKSMK
jgi:hypothetical protein